MKKTNAVGGFVLLAALLWSPATPAQEMGAFSSYLVGTYDQREGYSTKIHVVNPTAQPIEVLIAFFDDNERPLRCIKEKLSHNDLLELDVRALKIPAQFGVIKLGSFKDRKPNPGMVGFQRQYFKGALAAESNLASVPGSILSGELKIFMTICR